MLRPSLVLAQSVEGYTRSGAGQARCYDAANTDPSEKPMSVEARAALDRAVANNHVLHAILSLLTAGFWLIVWLLMVATNKRQRIVLSVNERGEVERTITTR